MAKNKYLVALENLTLVEEDKELNQISNETDRFFNWILDLIITKTKDKTISEYIFTIYEDDIEGMNSPVYLICKNKKYTSSIVRKDFYTVLNNIKDIFSLKGNSTQIRIKLEIFEYISGLVIIVTMIK